MSARASYPTCQHLHSNGRHCGSPALRSEQFCFYHHPTRRPPQRTRPSRMPFDVPAIADPEALQIALSEVIRRVADNTLDTKRAGLLLVCLQMAAANLGSLPPFLPGMDFSDLSGLAAGLGPALTHAFSQHRDPK